MTLVEDSGISRLQDRGDEELAIAFELAQPRLTRIVNLRLDSRLLGRVDTGDVLQDAFIEAKRRLPRYLQNPSVPVFIWLRGVVMDTLLWTHRRHLAKMRDATREVSLFKRGIPGVSSVSIASLLAADLTSPSGSAMQDELAEKVQEVLMAMDPIDREVLILRHFEELSNDEVASAVGVKKSAASRRYVRALQRFCKVLASVTSDHPQD